MIENTVVLLIADIRLTGGTERAVVNLANDLSEQGYDIKIASIFSAGGKSFYPLLDKVSLFHLGATFQQSLIKRVVFGFVELYSKLKKLYKASANSIFIATDPFVSFAMARLHHSRDKNRVIVCEHMALSISKSYSVWFRKLFLKGVTAFVVLTQRDQEFLKKILPNNVCYVIPNRISFYPDNLSSCESHTILSVGRLVPQKNYGALIDICVPVLQINPAWKLIIVGDGEQRDDLLRQIENKKMELQILIRKPTSHISDYFYNSGIYVMSSIYEGFPMVLLEAKSYGLPLVSYDCPNGPQEMIKDGDDGYLIPMDNQSEFRNKLETLMHNVHQRKEFGKRGSADVQNRYSHEKIIKKWEQLLETISA